MPGWPPVPNGAVEVEQAPCTVRQMIRATARLFQVGAQTRGKRISMTQPQSTARLRKAPLIDYGVSCHDLRRKKEPSDEKASLSPARHVSRRER